MPTLISHTVAGISGSLGFRNTRNPWKFMMMSVLCSVMPDMDVIGYHWFYIPYQSFFGHRGIFHSPFFAVVFSFLVVAIFFRKESPFTKNRWLFLYFFIITASHGLLDALTNGGQGIAMLAPFNNQRYFFPWQPIEVSPLGLNAFLSRRGLDVMLNEMQWIWIPSFLFAVSVTLVRNRKVKRKVPSPTL